MKHKGGFTNRDPQKYVIEGSITSETSTCIRSYTDEIFTGKSEEIE